MRGQQSLSDLHDFTSQNDSANGSVGHFLGIMPSKAGNEIAW